MELREAYCIVLVQTFLECVRLRTFGRYGLQQIQVDTHYLQLYLWRFVSDEKSVLCDATDCIFKCTYIACSCDQVIEKYLPKISYSVLAVLNEKKLLLRRCRKFGLIMSLSTCQGLGSASMETRC